MLAGELLRFRGLVYAKLACETKGVNRDESRVVLLLDMILKVSLHVGTIKPPQLLGFRRGLWNRSRSVTGSCHERNHHAYQMNTRHTPNENKIRCGYRHRALIEVSVT